MVRAGLIATFAFLAGALSGAIMMLMLPDIIDRRSILAATPNETPKIAEMQSEATSQAAKAAVSKLLNDPYSAKFDNLMVH